MRHILLLPFVAILLIGCAPDKQNALDHYEQIYKSSAPVRTSESRIFNALHDYVDAMNTTDSIYWNTLAMQDLRDSNAVIIANIDKAIAEIQTLEKFDHSADLAGKSVDILKAQRIFHETTVTNLIESFANGKTTSDDFIVAANGYDDALAAIKSRYKDYKLFRNQFCEDFGITYDDILVFQNKYAPEEEE